MQICIINKTFQVNYTPKNQLYPLLWTIIKDRIYMYFDSKKYLMPPKKIHKIEEVIRVICNVEHET